MASIGYTILWLCLPWLSTLTTAVLTAQVREVFESIGVGAELQSALFQTMSGVMHLGNIPLAEGPDGNTTVSQLAELKNSSKLLCTHEARLPQGPAPTLPLSRTRTLG